MSVFWTVLIPTCRDSLADTVDTARLCSVHVGFLDSNAYLWHPPDFHVSLTSSPQFRPQEMEDAMIRVSEHVRSTHNQDGAVVLDILHGQMFRLNLVGSRILELLKQGYTENEITKQLSQEFGVGRDVIASDLQEFLAHLEKHHLLRFRGTPTTL
jgi:hypothetical protein